MDVPLEILDREVARAAGELKAARARLARGDVDDAPNPLDAHRRVSSRATWLELAEVDGPLAAPLRAWVEALMLERVLWSDTVRFAAAWRAPSVTVAETGVAALTGSPREILLRVLGEADPSRRQIFAGALVRGAHPVQDAARILAERRVEAARLLHAGSAGKKTRDVGRPEATPARVDEHPDAVEIPIDPPAAIAAAAVRLLADTAPLLDRDATWSAALATAIGRSFGEGWPARLGPRWLFDLFRDGPLTEGLRLRIPDLPAPLGASSFARALGAFGATLADADGPGAPFAIARAPFDLRHARRSALFAALVADPVFAARALGLGRGRARDQARGIAGALLVTLRLDAARVLCRGLLSLPDGERVARFEEHTATAIGAPIPPSLAGVVPRLGPDDPARFAGALLAARDRRELIERFDEDWFKSPHAGRAIREEDANVPASRLAPAAQLDAGVDEIVRVLGAF